MTEPVPKTGPKHVVVDGSNVATEGRTSPSLKQLNEAVLSFMKEFPSTKITVVVDATFGHRIDKRETSEFNSAINNNELVAPPAGAVGRGDGFVLTIAEKIGASIFSNDSYKEFHGGPLTFAQKARFLKKGMVKGKPRDSQWLQSFGSMIPLITRHKTQYFLLCKEYYVFTFQRNLLKSTI